MHSKPERNYELGMDALLLARIQKLNGGNGCSGDRMLWGHVRNYDLGMDAVLIARIQKLNGIMSWSWMLWRPYALGTRTELGVGHGCSADRTHSKTERNYELGMDARASVCFGT